MSLYRLPGEGGAQIKGVFSHLKIQIKSGVFTLQDLDQGRAVVLQNLSKWQLATPSHPSLQPPALAGVVKNGSSYQNGGTMTSLQPAAITGAVHSGPPFLRQTTALVKHSAGAFPRELSTGADAGAVPRELSTVAAPPFQPS